MQNKIFILSFILLLYNQENQIIFVICIKIKNVCLIICNSALCRYEFKNIYKLPFYFVIGYQIFIYYQWCFIVVYMTVTIYEPSRVSKIISTISSRQKNVLFISYAISFITDVDLRVIGI